MIYKKNSEAKRLIYTKNNLKNRLADIDASNKDNDAEIIKLITAINKLDALLEKYINA